MKSKRINDNPVTHAVIFEKGDEFRSGLTEWAKSHDIHGAGFTAVGAFQKATLGYFNRSDKSYKKIQVGEQVEVLSLVGDIALKDGEPEVHGHAVVGKPDGATVGGHVLEGFVWPTLEVVVTESPAYLRRTHDPETGLALIDVNAR